MKVLTLLIGLLCPLQVAALEFKNLSLLYTDAPFLPAEAAGISLLTSINAVEGNPDGTFAPNRTLNRAEFLKIVLASYPKVRVSKSDAGDCFPDVRSSDWFSPYVCLAKNRGIVSGYPDPSGDASLRLFKPDRAVNYAEAIKILGELYDYVAYSAPDEVWYAGYVRAAEFHKTLLPSSLKFDRPLTRGQMARLAAGYRADYEGELSMYRLSEKSFDLALEEQKKLQESVEVKHSLASSSSSSPNPNPNPIAASRFLVLSTEELLATGHFRPQAEPAVIRNVVAEFRREVKNIANLYLVDAAGTHVAELMPDTYDKTDRTWKNSGPLQEAAVIALQGATLGLAARIKGPGAGYSEELIQPKLFFIYASAFGDPTNSYQIIPTSTSYPSHQTAMGRITDVRNNRPALLDITEGQRLLLAEFVVEGEGVGGAAVSVENLIFTLTEQSGITLSNLRLGAFHTATTIGCSMQERIAISCSSLPAAIGTIENGSSILQLWGDLAFTPGASGRGLQIDLLKPGTISTTINPGELGHVQWTDGSGEFKWVELPEPIATGSVWK